MSTVTLEAVVSAHAQLGEMLAALGAATKIFTLSLPAVQIELRPGERYAGAIVDANGIQHHVVLLPAEAKAVQWQAAREWAASIGGDLPSRREQSLLFANLKSEFQPEWYWSAEEHESNSSYAWYQYFGNGSQYYYRKSYGGRARAVRRFSL